MLYKVLYEGICRYENKSIKSIKEFQEFVMKKCDEALKNNYYEQIHAKVTLEELRKLIKENPEKVLELGKWLGAQPLARMERDNNRIFFAMAHAIFDAELCEYRVTLRNYYDLQQERLSLMRKCSLGFPQEKRVEKISYFLDKIYLTLWYRTKGRDGEFCIENAKKCIMLPGIEGQNGERYDKQTGCTYTFVCGHTPGAQIVHFYAKNARLPAGAVCVDSGHNMLSRYEEMLKYVYEGNDSYNGNGLGVTYLSI